MTPFAKSIAVAAAFAASTALAQTDPHAGHHPEVAAPQAGPAKPGDAPEASQGCPMMNGKKMMSASAMGDHMQAGRMVDKDGRLITGGMMMPNGMMCRPQASAGAEPGKAGPKADK